MGLIKDRSGQRRVGPGHDGRAAAQFFVDWACLRVKWITNDSSSGSVSVAGLNVLGFPIESPVQKYLFCLLFLIVFAVLVAVISCHKGLATRGGPAGVANSVNAAVVEAVLLMMIVNVVMSKLYVVLFPQQVL